MFFIVYLKVFKNNYILNRYTNYACKYTVVQSSLAIEYFIMLFQLNEEMVGCSLFCTLEVNEL